MVMPARSAFLETLLGAPSYGPVRLAIGKAMHWRYRLFQQRRHSRAVLERISGMPLLVTPGVLNPRLMRTGAFFASHLRPNVLTADAEVLDMGTGSGVCAIAAAQYARRVVAVDIDETAVRCARINVLLNRMDSKVEVLRGDLFEPLSGRRFDVVLFNPPFLRGVPRDDADRAWRSPDLAERFAARLRTHLRPSGYALVLLSTFGEPRAFIEEFRRHGFMIAIVSQRSFINENLAILKLTQGWRDAASASG
jgi:release factor glutamine methyltransferase